MTGTAESNEAPVEYRVCPARPQAHVFKVECRIAMPDPQGQRLRMPAWIPGSYLVRDFARHILAIEARCGTGSVEVVKTDKSTWQCAPCAGPLVVHYEVYAWDLSVRGAHLDTTHAYFNGTCLFLAVLGQENAACGLTLERPAGPRYEDWRVATAMLRNGADEHDFGRYYAADYDELIDHPVEMGEHAQIAFEVCGVPHTFAIYGRQAADLDRLCADAGKICAQHHALFGAPPPIDRYVFLVMALGEGYGGLEHRWSSSLMCRRDELPQHGMQKMEKDYRRFLGLVSHEYFHLWNVKRIKPAAFTPYRLDRERHTGLLWVFEGITSYYDDLALVRSGVIDSKSYLELLGATITRVWQTPGRARMSLAESSFDAWTKLYKADENAPNALISYYTKGALAALALDLVVRRDTGGAMSLDDVVRALWEAYGETGEGLGEDDFERLAAQVTGLDLTKFFDAAIRGREDLPLAELLAGVGVRFKLRAQEETDDDAAPLGQYLPTLGVRVGSENGAAVLRTVFEHSAAQEAGLSAGDHLLAIDGLRAVPDNIRKSVASHAPGDKIDVHLFRRDELMRVRVTLAEAPADRCILSLNPQTNARTRAACAAWLGQAES